MGENLIPNGDFAEGLSGWECSPSGVSLVTTASKRFILLSGEATASAILSSPIKLIPGAAYKVSKSVALAGDCELQLRTDEGSTPIELAGEFIAPTSVARIQISSDKSKRVGISEVRVEPIGARMELISVSDDYALRESGDAFQITAYVANSGSTDITRAKIRLIPTAQKLAEEHRSEQSIETLRVGATQSVSWGVLGQSRAISPFKIELEFAGKTAAIEGISLRHRPRLPAERLIKSVSGNKRCISIANRGLRITAHETDLDFGPLHIYGERNRTQIGVFHQMAQLKTKSHTIPLWTSFKRVTPSSVELVGKSDIGDWSIVCSAEHHERGISFEVRLRMKKRIPNAVLELLPLASLKTMRCNNGAIELLDNANSVHLQLSALRGEPLHLSFDESANVTSLKSKIMNLMPSSNLRATALVKLL